MKNIVSSASSFNRWWYLLTALLFLAGLLSCSKEQLTQDPPCRRCLLISEKFDTPEEYKPLKTDTLWNSVVCGELIDSIRKQKPDQFYNCDTGLWERWFYIIK